MKNNILIKREINSIKMIHRLEKRIHYLKTTKRIINILYAIAAIISSILMVHIAMTLMKSIDCSNLSRALILGGIAFMYYIICIILYFTILDNNVSKIEKEILNISHHIRDIKINKLKELRKSRTRNLI